MADPDMFAIMAQATAVLSAGGNKVGRTGRVESDGSVTIWVPDRVGYIFVREGVEDTIGIIEARLIGAPAKADQRVIYRRDIDGDYSVVSIDYLSGLTASNDYNVAYHQHGRHTGLDWIVPPNMVGVGRVHWSGSAMTVVLTSFRYLHSGNWQTFSGATVDLSSYAPANSGAWAWVLLGVDPDTNSAVAVTGDEYAYAQPLHIHYMDDIAFDNWIPIGAVRVREDDTILDDADDYFDAHGWFNQDLGGGGGGVESFVDLDDVPVSYSGQANKLVAVTTGEDGLEFVSPSVGGVDDFLDLDDTPSDYSGQASKFVAVTAGADGLEFVDAPAGGAEDFVDLGDVPASYTGHAYSTLVVTDSEDGVEFRAYEQDFITDWSYKGTSFSGTTYSWKGNEFTPDRNVELLAMCLFATMVASATYQAAIVGISGSSGSPGTVASTIKTATYTTPGSIVTAAGGFIWLYFDSPKLLTAGTPYGLMLGRTDSTDNYAMPVAWHGGTGAGNAVPMFGRSHGRSYRIADADLQVGATIDYVSSDSVSCGFRFRYP